MEEISKSLFGPWDVRYENAGSTIVLSSFWLDSPTAAVELTEHCQGGDGMDHTLILHLDEKPGGAPSQEVVFRADAEEGFFDVVAIKFPDDQFERIYLPNYDSRNQPE